MIPSKHQFDGHRVRISDVFDLQMGKTPSRKNPLYWRDGNHDWVSIADLGSFGKYVGKTKERINDFAVKESGIKLTPANTVLMSFKLSLGKTSITTEPVYTNEAIMAFINKGLYPVDTSFMYHQCRSKDWAAGTNAAVMGKTLNKRTLGQSVIFLPSLEEQEDIAAKLDFIDEQLQKAKDVLHELDSLVKSRFVEMFGDFKTNVKCWPVANFDSFAFIDTHMTKDFDKYADEPHIGIDSIEAKTGRLVGYRTVAEDKLVSGKYPFTAKHIIYSKIRPNLNKVALPDFSGLCSADAYPIMPIEGKSNRVFLAHVMRSDYFLDYILPLSGRAQMPKVNKDAIRGFSMPLPPIDLQNTFAAFAAQVDKSRFAGTFTGTINVKNYAISCSVHNNSGRIPNEALHSAREVTECALFELQELYDSLTQKYFAL